MTKASSMAMARILLNRRTTLASFRPQATSERNPHLHLRRVSGAVLGLVTAPK